MANPGGPNWQELSKYDTNGWKGESRELQVCQSDLAAGEGDGADHI